jgi:nucleoside-diphosphate-sugar epimerase
MAAAGKSVVVTGANGHLGCALVLDLLNHGYQVTATVRDPSDLRKTAHLRDAAEGVGAAKRLDIVAGDLMDANCWGDILAGKDGLFQVAAVYSTMSKNPQEDIIDPSIVGTLNPLRAAAEQGVSRVVYTSSIAAVGGMPEGRAKTESDWNENFSLPYTYAKTESEKRAWALAEECGLDLRVCNPGMIWGPHFSRHTPSTEIMSNLIRGKYPMAAKIGFAIVDSRDVASAHRLAYEIESAEGRFLLSAIDLQFIDMGKRVKAVEPKAKVPKIRAPWPLVQVNLFFDWGMGLFGRKRTMSRAIVKSMRRGTSIYDCSKSHKVLGWKPRPLEETIRDTIDACQQLEGRV